MKKICVLLLAGACYTLANMPGASAQIKVTYSDPKNPGIKHEFVTSPATGKNRYITGKTINQETVGVMGVDTIRVNNKGMRLNQNYGNSGVVLPPSSGFKNK